MAPVATFIARVRETDAVLRSMTVDEVAALPAVAAAAMAELQAAIRDLDASQQDAADGPDDPFSLERFQASHHPGTRPARF